MGRAAAAARTGFIFHPGFLLPAAAAGRARGPRPLRPRPSAAARTCWRGSASRWPLPGSGAPPSTRGPSRTSPGSRAEDSRPGLASPPPRGRRRPGRPERDCGGASRELGGRGPGAARGPRAGPDAGPRGGGREGGCKALRWRWAWPVARAGGAVARRAPFSLAARAAPSADAAKPGARGSRARSVDGVGAAGVFALPRGPQTHKGEAAGLERLGTGAGVWVLPARSWGSRWAGVGPRGPRGLPGAASPAARWR